MKVKIRQRCNFIVKSESNSVANKTLKSEHLKTGDGQQILLWVSNDEEVCPKSLQGGSGGKQGECVVIQELLSNLLLRPNITVVLSGKTSSSDLFTTFYATLLTTLFRAYLSYLGQKNPKYRLKWRLGIQNCNISA